MMTFVFTIHGRRVRIAARTYAQALFAKRAIEKAGVPVLWGVYT